MIFTLCHTKERRIFLRSIALKTTLTITFTSNPITLLYSDQERWQQLINQGARKPSSCLHKLDMIFNLFHSLVFSRLTSASTLSQPRLWDANITHNPLLKSQFSLCACVCSHFRHMYGQLGRFNLHSFKILTSSELHLKCLCSGPLYLNNLSMCIIYWNMPLSGRNVQT